VIDKSVCDATKTNDKDVDAFDKDMHKKGFIPTRVEAGHARFQTKILRPSR
jgi:hypothetical protein